MSRSILAVDDELHMLRLLEQLIGKRTPYRILTTHNALEVPGLLASQEFDVVITDLRMPGLSGMDILNLIREGNREEEVIMITAFGTLDSAAEAIALGVFDYITKPFRKERLLNAIEGAMQKRTANQYADELSEMFLEEPYTEAEKRFKKAYLENMSVVTAGDIGMMAERSGIPFDEIKLKMRNDDS